jgi:hypothetical protein
MGEGWRAHTVLCHPVCMSTGLDPWMNLVLIGFIVLLGGGGLAFFYFSGGKPHGGVTRLNIRAVGIVFVVVAAALLAVIYERAVVAAVGLLGAVAGYLFGASSGGDNESQVTTGDVSGDNAKIAGRDLIEKLESLSTTVESYGTTLASVAEAAEDHGFQVHEERIMRTDNWVYTHGVTSEIALAHTRALRKFPPPEYRLITVSTVNMSDFAHVVFVFAAATHARGEVLLSLDPIQPDEPRQQRSPGR